MIHVVLYQPKIPPNTGNIARQCVGMNAMLHLVGPIDFDLRAHAVKRAGLDYWEHLELQLHDDPKIFVEWLNDRQPWLITRRGTHSYDQVEYRNHDVLIFGNELDGLPPNWHERWPDRRVHIPMPGKVRSYNLSNAVALVLAQACATAGLFDQ